MLIYYLLAVRLMVESGDVNHFHFLKKMIYYLLYNNLCINCELPVLKWEVWDVVWLVWATISISCNILRRLVLPSGYWWQTGDLDPCLVVCPLGPRPLKAVPHGQVCARIQRIAVKRTTPKPETNQCNCTSRPLLLLSERELSEVPPQ